MTMGRLIIMGKVKRQYRGGGGPPSLLFFLNSYFFFVNTGGDSLSPLLWLHPGKGCNLWNFFALSMHVSKLNIWNEELLNIVQYKQSFNIGRNILLKKFQLIIKRLIYWFMALYFSDRDLCNWSSFSCIPTLWFVLFMYSSVHFVSMNYAISGMHPNTLASLQCCPLGCE